MSIDKDYLKEVWNSVWEEGLTELEVQRRYFAKLEKELKGEDRFHLLALGKKVNELEMEIPFADLLSSRMKEYDLGQDKVCHYSGLSSVSSYQEEE